MPTYDYLCPNCNNSFEKIVSLPDPEIPQPCPTCESLSPTYMPIGRKHHIKFLFNYMED